MKYHINKEQYTELRQVYTPLIPGSINLTAEEEIVDAYLTRLKKKADVFYRDGNPYGIIDWKDEDDIQNDLYEFCFNLPKCSDLHVHDNTMIPIDLLLDILVKNTRISLDKDTFGFLYTKKSDRKDNTLDLEEAIEKGLFSIEELKERLTLSQEDAETGYWASLEEIFTSTGDLYNDMDLMEKIWEEGFLSCYERGILLVEIRDYYSVDDQDNIRRDMAIRQAYYNVRKKHPDFLVRLIACSGKEGSVPVQEAFDALRSAIRISRIVKDEFDSDNVEDFIIGLDLVNEEDVSKPISDYVDFFLSDEVSNSGLGLFLHCGESLRKDNNTVIDAYMLRAKRAGHAMNLYRFPELMERYVENKIAVEVCPLSNFRLGYVADMRLHPALQYLIHGIPVVICSDDGTFMSRQPLVDDFYAVILSWDLNLGDIKMICRNSLEYSGLSQKEINRLRDCWQTQWSSFIETMVRKIH